MSLYGWNTVKVGVKHQPIYQSILYKKGEVENMRERLSIKRNWHYKIQILVKCYKNEYLVIIYN